MKIRFSIIQKMKGQEKTNNINKKYIIKYQRNGEIDKMINSMSKIKMKWMNNNLNKLQLIWVRKDKTFSYIIRNLIKQVNNISNRQILGIAPSIVVIFFKILTKEF